MVFVSVHVKFGHSSTNNCLDLCFHTDIRRDRQTTMCVYRRICGVYITQLRKDNIIDAFVD